MKLNKYRYLYFILLFIKLLLLLSCDSFNKSSSIDFSNIEIHYIISDSIEISKLDIFPNGLVKAVLIRHFNNDILVNDSTILSDNHKDKIIKLFQSFTEFHRYYEPAYSMKDNSEHRIIFLNNQVPDTVDIYMPFKSNLPINLKKSIIELTDIWNQTVKNSLYQNP
jgi:hypothetical protein